MLFSLLCFSYIFYLAFFGFKLNEYEISEYMKSFINNNSKYESSTNNAIVNVRNLVENSQVEELKHHDELIDKASYNKGEDPFSKFSQ